MTTTSEKTLVNYTTTDGVAVIEFTIVPFWRPLLSSMGRKERLHGLAEKNLSLLPI